MFSWDTLRLGCLRMHCMIQRGVWGEASSVGKDGGPRCPSGDPCSSRSLRRAWCQTGLQGGSGGSGTGKAEEGRGGQSPAGGGTVGSLSSCFAHPLHNTGCKITPRRLPAAAQVEGTSFPTVICASGVLCITSRGWRSVKYCLWLLISAWGLSAQPAHKRPEQRGLRSTLSLPCRAAVPTNTQGKGS